MAADRASFRLESGTAAVRGQLKRAYNRDYEVLLSMGSLAPLERRGVWSGRWITGYDLHHWSAGRLVQSTDQAAMGVDCAKSQRSNAFRFVGLALVLFLSSQLRADKLSFDERLEIERGLEAEFATAKVMLPHSKKALVIHSDGQYDQHAWTKALDEQGPAARLGDQVQITRVEIESNKILLEINGGSRAGHWYDHVQVGMGGTTSPVGNRNGQGTANGSHLALVFPGSVPSLKAADIRQMLSPILDFEKHSAAEQYVDNLPEPIKKAIKEQKAIEGMDHDQVLLALGKPRNKSRETNADGDALEDWIYGEPPGRVTFVRFNEGKVVKVQESYANIGGMTSPPLPSPR